MTTTPEQRHISSIARRLSETMKSALCYPDAYITDATRKALRERLLGTPGNLTPLGEAVRAFIMERDA